MCNLYAMTSNQKAIRKIAKVFDDLTGNLQSLPEIYPNTTAQIVRNGEGSRELVMARWGMPTPPGYLEGHKVGSRCDQYPQFDLDMVEARHIAVWCR